MTPEEELAAMLEIPDYPGAWTERERTTYTAKRDALQMAVRVEQARAKTERDCRLSLSTLDSTIANRERWKAMLPVFRQALCDELLIPRGRTRPELNLLANLEASIRSIDKGLEQILGAPSGCFTLRSLRLGELLVAAGLESDMESDRVFGGLQWRGSTKEVERELADLRRQREVLAAQLAEVSLSADERASRQAERNARPTRKVRGDGTQYDKYPDGTIVEVEATSS